MLRRLKTPAGMGTTKHRFTALWIALGLWLGLVGILALQGVLVDSESWRTALGRSVSYWVLWIVFLPVIVTLSLRFPLERSRLVAQAGIHLAACAVMVLVSQVAYRTFLPMPLPTSPRQAESEDFRNKPFPPAFRAVPDIVIFLSTLSGCLAFAHFRRSQERERQAIELEAHLARAKLQALRMQINPHFLFNTLNAISSLVHTNPDVADDMITDLSELFRASLESSDDQEISLARELEFLQRYLAIEQRRFGERLRVEQNITTESLGAAVPTLILQPIVENAIRHGVESRPAAGVIAIQAQTADGQLILSVSDNGGESKSNLATETKPGHAGIGLANTRARLQQLYGNAQSLVAGPGELGGWTVTITIPFQPAPVRRSLT